MNPTSSVTDCTGKTDTFDGNNFIPELCIDIDNKRDKAFWLWVEFCIKTKSNKKFKLTGGFQ